MVQRTGWRARKSSRVAMWLAPIGVAAGLAGACAQLQGSLGEDCLKDQDCQSGVCSQFRCVAAPPLLVLDASVQPESSTGDGGSTGNDGAPMDEATIEGDSAPVPDATVPDVVVPPLDAAADVVDEHPVDDGSVDAPSDARGDGAGDHDDAGEAG